MSWWRGILWIVVMGVLMLLSMFLVAVPAPPMNRIGRFRWVFELLGWRATWIALACLTGLSLIFAIRALATRGKVDSDDG